MQKRQLPSFFLRAQRVMTKDFQRLDDTFIKHFLNLFMNDASFSRRDSVGSLVDWSMITSKNPVFHIRLRSCRLVGLREKPRKFSGVVRIACFSVRHLTRVTSLTNNSSVTPKFLAGHPSNPMCRK
ncbi:hypothetical protein TNCV_2307551 [Trichonephila clavipes]|nr:hypothetical protein TNCV_2307551 [Trichonephila clavipes]